MDSKFPRTGERQNQHQHQHERRQRRHYQHPLRHQDQHQHQPESLTQTWREIYSPQSHINYWLKLAETRFAVVSGYSNPRGMVAYAGRRYVVPLSAVTSKACNSSGDNSRNRPRDK